MRRRSAPCWARSAAVSRGALSNAGATTTCADADEFRPQRDRLLGLSRPRRLFEIRLDRRADQRLERRLLERVPLEQDDGAPRAAVATPIQPPTRIGHWRGVAEQKRVDEGERGYISRDPGGRALI